MDKVMELWKRAAKDGNTDVQEALWRCDVGLEDDVLADQAKAFELASNFKFEEYDKGYNMLGRYNEESNGVERLSRLYKVGSVTLPKGVMRVMLSSIV